MARREFHTGWLPALAVGFLLCGAPAGAEDAPAHEYVGVKKCKACHLKEFKSWSATPHAMALETLKPGMKVDVKKKVGLNPDQDYSTDAKCVGCHVTGMGKPGGFESEEKTPDLANVTCEACHGAGSGYLADGFMTMKNKEYKLSQLIGAGLVLPKTETCAACHNKNSPTFDPASFDFEKLKATAGHEKFPLKYDHKG